MHLSYLPSLCTQSSPGLALAAALCFSAANPNLVSAQCTSLDLYEPNQSCSTATPLHTGWTRDLNVSPTNEDHYSLWLPAGATCTVDLEFEHAAGDINIYVYASCGGVTSPLTLGLSTTDNESVSWSNSGFLQKEYFVRVVAFQPSTCASYDIHASIPICPLDDRFELNNDICSLGGTPPPQLLPGTYNALASHPGDVDYYRVAVPPGATVDVKAWHDQSSSTFRLDVRPSCLLPPIATSVHTDGHESLRWSNQGAATQEYFFRLFRINGTPFSPCYEYGLTVDLSCEDDDLDQTDDTCTSAQPALIGTLFGRVVRLGDDDWYSVVVPNSSILRTHLTFSHADADVNLTIQGCPSPLLAIADSQTDDETVSWLNDTGSAVEVFVRIHVNDNAPLGGACATYNLTVFFQGGLNANIVPSCFGTSLGTPCPCNNNSPVGHNGGCAHQDGPGAVLSASGQPRVGPGDGPHFQLASGPANTFAVLVSGDNALPVLGPCAGCGIASFDGLRCVGGNFKRHGSRAIDGSGNSGAGWGPPSPPLLGIAYTSGFLSGQTRHFQAFYRTALDQTCGTGQNASNSVSATFGY